MANLLPPFPAFFNSFTFPKDVVGAQNLLTMATSVLAYSFDQLKGFNPLQHLGKSALAGLVGLGIVYNDRAAFDEKRPDIAQEPGWPILGNIPIILKWVPYFHEFGVEAFTRMDQLTVYVLCLLLSCQHQCLMGFISSLLLAK